MGEYRARPGADRGQTSAARPGRSAYALRGEDVDFLRRTVRIDWQIAQDTRERVPPKTPRSRRTLPLPAFVDEAISEHLQHWPAGVDGLLFHTGGGTAHWQNHYGTRVFKVAVERAGLPAGTTSHDLRHHYASVQFCRR